MAQKRMFNKSITNSSMFLMMPSSTQSLYFHLGMNADDDGFCEHFTIMRMTESKPDDLKILAAKHFVKVFDEKVLIILDWKENNYIRSDRYTPSKYLQIYKEELKLINSGIPEDNQTVDIWDTQFSIDKNSIDKNSIDIYDLLDEWNNQLNTQTHKKTTIERNIKKRRLNTYLSGCIEDYGVDEIKRAISNYSHILGSEIHYWTHSWGFIEFMERGLDKFLDSANPLDVYRDKKVKTKEPEMSLEERIKKNEEELGNIFKGGN